MDRGWKRRHGATLVGGLWLAASLLASGCSSEEGKSDTPSACEPGSLGCACDAESSCATDLRCEANVCVGAASVGLSVDPRARGCEVLLEAPRARVTGVDFSEDVRGTFVSEAPRTAVTFIAADDAPIPDGAVRIRYLDEGEGAPSLSTVHCTDQGGAPIADAEVKSHG